MLGLLNGMFASPAKTIEVENSDKIREVMESLACVNWLSQDQQLLSYLLCSMTREILVQASYYEHAFDVCEPSKLFKPSLEFIATHSDFLAHE